MKAGQLLFLAAMFAEPALAQRPAVSAELSPEMAAEVFKRTVMEVCVPAAAGGGVGALAAAKRGGLVRSDDPATRKQAGAGAADTVWDVTEGKGVVTVHEKPGRCVVSVYGPEALKTIASVAQAMEAAPGFERLAGSPPPDGLAQSMFFSSGGRSMIVQLKGAEPGTPGHQSRFSVVTATVFAGQ